MQYHKNQLKFPKLKCPNSDYTEPSGPFRNLLESKKMITLSSPLTFLITPGLLPERLRYGVNFFLGMLSAGGGIIRVTLFWVLSRRSR
jgi:hypothetical protein